jgi:hypothetical protein
MSDRIEPEFAPTYNGKYIAIEKRVLTYNSDEDYEEHTDKYDDIPYVIFKRTTDQHIIHIFEHYESEDDGKPLYFGAPVDDDLEPILLTPDDIPDRIAEHYNYANCIIYGTLQDELLNISRVVRLKKEGETVTNNIPSDIEKNIQKFLVKNTKIDKAPPDIEKNIQELLVKHTNIDNKNIDKTKI